MDYTLNHIKAQARQMDKFLSIFEANKPAEEVLQEREPYFTADTFDEDHEKELEPMFDDTPSEAEKDGQF